MHLISKAEVMSKFQRLALISLLAIFLCQAGLVEAICGHCYGPHACINENTAQLCFDGVPNANYNITCPENMPICTAFGQMCMANITGVTPACGDTSQCSRCSEGQIFACTSRTSFAYCSDGEAQGSGIFCPPDYLCSVYGAAVGSPCALVCEPAPGDICDRDDNTASTSTLKDTRRISSLHTYEV